MIIPGTDVDLIEEEDQVVAKLLKWGTFEPETIQAWLDHVGPGSSAVDVGAYSGLFAISAAQAGAKAVAIEPMPIIFERLLENVQRNSVQIRTLQAAASDVTGTTSIFSKGRLSSTSRLSSFPKARETKITTVTLDSIGLVDVSAIKIDVEGFEALVLNGAHEIIRRDKPVIILEALDDAEIIKSNLMHLGYSCVRSLDQDNLLFKPIE